MTGPPFEPGHLDCLLEQAAAAAVVATSPHNVRYLSGSYSAFHASFDAIGTDRFLPAVGYERGAPEHAFSIGCDVDASQHQVEPVWIPHVLDCAQSCAETAALVADRLRALGLGAATVALELSFTPQRFITELARHLPHLDIVEAAPLLEELRAVKRADELESLKVAAERIVQSLAAAAHAGGGMTTAEIARQLRVEESTRGLDFEYSLIAAGADLNRTPSMRRWGPGAVLSIDSGGRYCGYIGDLCRMAVRGTPPAACVDLLADVRAVQDAARLAARAGAPGAAVYEAADDASRSLSREGELMFVAHGMGLVPHEAPRLSASAPIRYPAAHRDRELESGMVLSIETDLRMPGIGLLKLEDTVVVTPDGGVGYGDEYRDWIVVET